MDESIQEQELASRWKRLGGALLDSLIAIVVTVPVMMATGVLEQINSGEQMTIGQSVFFFFYGLILFLTINGYLLTTYGQTVGKKIIGTRIVSAEDGQLLSFGRVYGLRYFIISVVAQIPVIGGLLCLADSLFIFKGDKRCIHDMIAGSKVINA